MATGTARWSAALRSAEALAGFSPKRDCGLIAAASRLRRMRAMSSTIYPWLDHRGRLSPLKLTVFALLLVPGAWTIAAYPLDALGARPLNEAIHQFGL